MSIDMRSSAIVKYTEKETGSEQKLNAPGEHVAANQAIDKAIHFYKEEIIMDWQAPEFEVYEKSFWWYIVAAALDIAIVIYALISNNPIMAITFILVGIVGYIYLQKDPRIIHFAITPNGIITGNEIYSFENIDSFWIFYDPPHTKILSLHTKAKAFPFVHIPIDDQDPVKIHTIISEYIPEIEQHCSLLDTIERVFHI